jgi:hypothetical protein
MHSPHLHLMADTPPKMNDAAKHRLDYFRLLFEQGPSPCVVTDSACIVIDANRAAETILLWPLAGMVELPFQRMIGASDLRMFNKIAADILMHVFEASRPLCMKPHSGDEIDVLFKAKAIRNSEGSTEFISWVFLESLALGSSELV